MSGFLLQAMLMQMLQLTNEQVNALPPTERLAIQQLVSVLYMLYDVMPCDASSGVSCGAGCHTSHLFLVRWSEVRTNLFYSYAAEPVPGAREQSKLLLRCFSQG
jgi:Transcription termination and cleavage factor C-terminal